MKNGLKTKHRLVIVEGIMGSGKSTTMRHIASRLTSIGHQVHAFHERSSPHPVRATDDLKHWFKPWLDVTSSELAKKTVLKWRSFVDRAQASESVSIFDGQLFHGDFTNLFLMEAERPELEEHIQILATTIKRLDPLVIYFYQNDVDMAIRTIVAERGAEWGKYQTDWKLQAPYSLRRGFEGLEGLSALYTDYRKMTDHLYTILDLPRIAIENSSGDWQRYYAQIDSALGLSVQGT